MLGCSYISRPNFLQSGFNLNVVLHWAFFDIPEKNTRLGSRNPASNRRGSMVVRRLPSASQFGFWSLHIPTSAVASGLIHGVVGTLECS